MRLKIDHETRYRYEHPLRHSVQTLRLWPRNNAAQRVVSWHIETDANAPLPAFEDSFGNVTHTLCIDQPHDSVRVHVTGEVMTNETHGVIGETFEAAPPLVFCRDTDLTRPDDALVALAESCRGGAAADPPALDILHRLLDAVADQVDYRVGETHAETTAAEALAHGYGVCQDHAHVFAACARHLGFPARYVSGYMWHNPDEPDGEAAHAWAEAYISDLGWVGFDPSNRRSPNEAYVRLAAGLDKRMAAPILGLRHGGGAETIAVTVRVAQARSAGQA